MREWVDEIAEAMDVEMLVMDGLDDAIIGVTSETEPRVVYSEGLIIKVLMEDGCTEEEAWDHYGFNILGSLQADHAYPVIIKTPE